MYIFYFISHLLIYKYICTVIQVANFGDIDTIGNNGICIPPNYALGLYYIFAPHRRNIYAL